MSQKSRIFVHGLKAHADEMWACALLIASKPEIEFTEIIRDAKRIGEADGDDFILDCGMKYDGKHLFDHHQFESTEDVDCSLSLIAKTFAPWVLSDHKFGKLIERVRVQDNFGVAEAEKKFGDSSSWLFAEQVSLELFAKEPMTAARILADGFVKRLAEISEVDELLKWIPQNSHTETVGRFKVLVIEHSPVQAGFSLTGFNSASTIYAGKEKIEIIFGWNSDGSDSRTLFRTRCGKDIYFTEAKPENEVFCHNSGFLLIFDPAADDEYKELIIQSDVSEKNVEKSA